MSGAYNVKQALLAAYRHLLTPLVRILLRNGISYLEFAEVARQVFVDVAGRDFTLPKRKISLSRIAIMTGLSRKEVARLAKEGSQSKRINLEGKQSRVGRVLQGWYTDSEFTGPYGVPLDLKFDDVQKRSTFSELVRRYSGDMPARAMFDELLRVGAVRIEGESNLIRVLNRSYIPETLDSENVRHFGVQTRNFIDTLDFNMRKSAPGKGRFERFVIADDGISEDDVERFDSFLRERGQQFLVELDDWLAARPKLKSGQPVVHTGVGVYHFMKSKEADRALVKMIEEGDGNESDEFN